MKLIKGLSVALAVAGAAMGATAASAEDDHHSWSGLYFGANAGWVRQNLDWSFDPPVPGGAHQAYSLDQSTGIFGGQVGFQHQFDHVVVGVEMAYSGTPGNKWGRDPAFGINNAFNSEAQITDLFQIGGRLGWAPNHHWMLYATGGYATGNVQTRELLNANPLVTGTQTNNRQDGWYVGGGVEYALNQHWVLGAEYQHVDLGTATHCGSDPGGCLGAAAGYVDRDIGATADIVRARLSFKIGGREEEHHEDSLK